MQKSLTSARRMMPRLLDLRMCFEEVYEEFRQDLLENTDAVEGTMGLQSGRRRAA